MKTLPPCGFVPLQNYVVVLLDSVPTETPGGIVLPESVVKPAKEGVVIAVGPGIQRKNGVFSPTQARAGDRVTVTGQAQTPWHHDGVDFVLMREPEILVVHGDTQAPSTPQPLR